ncbi:MAG: anti-sigma factor family protein [Coriobacteriia bacterium]
MTCEEVRDDLEMYIGGDLGDERSAAVAAHLARCEECARAYEHTRLAIAGLKDLGAAYVPVERFEPAAAAPVSSRSPARAGWGWRLATAAALVVSLVSVSALTVPAVAKTLPLPLGNQIEQLEEDNERLADEVEELKIQLKEIGGEQVPVVETAEPPLPPEVNAAVQELAMAFIKAQYANDLDALKALSTDRLKAEIERDPRTYLRPKGAVVFAQMTDVSLAEGDVYLVFVRLSDSVEFTDSQFQEDFEIKKVGEKYLVDFMGMDA